MPEEIKKVFHTNEWAQCRNEAPFPVTIKMVRHPVGDYDTPSITCPHCGRTYLPGKDGEWGSNRTLKFLSFPEEVDEARKTCIK